MEKKQIKIIVDSCCDMTAEMRKKLDVTSVPLTIRIPGHGEIIDDEKMDVKEMMKLMKEGKKGASTACPPPDAYYSYMEPYDECFVVTLSAKLSGSYNSARVAKEMIEEKYPDKKVHIVDSKFASSAETLIALFLHDKINEGLSFEEIVPLAEQYRDSINSLVFVEDLSNLIKNGRLKPLAGKIATVLNICPILANDGNGEVVPIAKVRGIDNALNKMVNVCIEKTKHFAAKSRRLVIGYALCPERAAILKDKLLEKCVAVKEIFLVPAGGISSIYAADKGLLFAF